MGIGGAVIVVDMVMGQPGGPVLQPPLHGDFGIGIHMAHIQAQPQTGIIHRRHNVPEQVGLRLQHIFQTQHRVPGHRLHKFLPEHNGLLHIPNGVVHKGLEAAVDHQLADAVAFGQSHGLSVPPGRQLPGLQVDGAGEELIEGCVEDKAVGAGQLFPHLGVDLGKIPVHIPGGAEFRQLNAQTPFLRQKMGVGIGGGQIDVSHKTSLEGFEFQFTAQPFG